MLSALIAFVTHYNFPIYALGALTVAWMFLWPLGSVPVKQGGRPRG